MALSFPKPLQPAFQGKYRNPVRAGDFPDPSVIRPSTSSGHARTFYAVTTSTDWAPFFRIFTSADLVDWELVGHVFARRPDWCAGNFWAPDFAEKDGRFYVYYTARRKDGPLCVAVATAERPEGPYTDHGPLIGQRYGSIDAMAADDADGSRWLLWKEDGLDGRWLPPWDAGVRIALAVGGPTGASARFGALRFEPAPAAVTRLEPRTSKRARLAAMLSRATPARRLAAK